MEGDPRSCPCWQCPPHFNPLPPHGGRLLLLTAPAFRTIFQSTPSAWRETASFIRTPICIEISIHSLRMEGDACSGGSSGRLINFNPLPPHGGRLFSGRSALLRRHFNPLPPHGGRPIPPQMSIQVLHISIHSLRMEGDTRHALQGRVKLCISIHSLRMEGDESSYRQRRKTLRFQSTPSAWRETSLNDLSRT